MDYQEEDAKIALDIVDTLDAVALRVVPTGKTNGWGTAFVSPSIARFGYVQEDFLAGNLSWTDIVHPQDLPSVLAQIHQHRQNKNREYQIFCRIIDKRQNSTWVHCICKASHNKDGKVLHVDCIFSDHSEAHLVKSQLKKSLRQQKVLKDILSALNTQNPEENYRAILAYLGACLGVSRAVLYQDLPGKACGRLVNAWQVANTPLPNRETLQYADVLGLDAFLKDAAIFLVNCGEGRGDYFESEGILSLAALPIYCGKRLYGFILLEDAAKGRQWLAQTLVFLDSVCLVLGNALLRQESAAENHRAIYQDQLTGLINRYKFDDYLEKAIERAEQKNQHGFVLFIDMDDFKIINEGYGHQYGDALLVEVATYLQEKFADKCTLFRFSGDEFVLLIQHEHAEFAQGIMDDILSRARHPWKVLNNEFYCTVSLGVVRFPDSGMAVGDVIKNADIAIHSAKSLGKNNCVVFNRGMDNDSLQRVEMERRMRACIENDFEGFKVYYQPVVDINGKIVGAEALLRWFDKDGNLTSPAEFIPLAEYLGLIVPLGNFVLRNAAKECLRINQTLPEFFMNVNVSIKQFQQQNFLEVLEDILTQVGTNYTNIVLEVTEGMLVDDMEQMQRLFSQLRLMGMQIAMDDFGTGYSSLSSMRRLPLDVIKIDRSFVVDVTHDAYAQSFIRLITNLAHSMGRSVCVEGVESAAQYSYCAECRVDRIQGFYFHRPMHKNQLWQVLALNGGSV